WLGGTSDLETMNLNLSGAYRLNELWSFGLGFDAVYARAKIEGFAGDLGQLVGAQNPALAPVAGRIPGDPKVAHLQG
ncbi:outer membrane protein transport protein, partial [Salmonella enterica]|uniref:outer membrane protein transport protein n=1 Tax=Salmonella enterica TaxID=28901 RepID=UPI0032972F47